jgi:hypothetical protein
MTRLLSTDVLTADLEPLATLGTAEVGLWGMEPGTDHDTEVDEVFVVLAPGVAVRLHAGERTTWVVTETLRKVYVAL